MRRLTAVLLAASLLTAAAACSDDSSDDASPPSSAELATKLLTPADVPAGWSAKPPAVDGQEGNSDEQGPECLKDDPGDPHIGTAGTTLTQATGFPTLEEELYSYRDEDADAAIARSFQRIDECTTFTFTEGTLTFDGTITRVAGFPVKGDATAAWQMHFGSGPLAFDFVILAVRTGSNLVSVSYGQAAGGDTAAALEQTSQLADAALAKL